MHSGKDKGRAIITILLLVQKKSGTLFALKDNLNKNKNVVIGSLFSFLFLYNKLTPFLCLNSKYSSKNYNTS